MHFGGQTNELSAEKHRFGAEGGLRGGVIRHSPCTGEETGSPAPPYIAGGDPEACRDLQSSVSFPNTP